MSAAPTTALGGHLRNNGPPGWMVLGRAYDKPIERQCTRFARAGVEVAPQTLGRSVSAAIDLLAPIARLIEDQTRAPGLLGTDATGLPVLDPDTTEGIRHGTRAASSSRRRAPAIVALEGVRILARIFAVERESTFAGDTAEQRRVRREPCTQPILDELRSWLERQRGATPPKTPLGQGLGHLDRQWRRLLLFISDGNIEATNNRRERELRRLILGRKNWLFTWLDEGAQRTGDILTVVATCIAHDVNPRAYPHRIVASIVNGWPQAKLRELLPDRMLLAHPDLYVGDPEALPMPATARALAP